MEKKTAFQKGFADILALMGIVIILLVIPLSVNLVQKSQELRKLAVYPTESPTSQPTPTPEPTLSPCDLCWRNSIDPYNDCREPCNLTLPTPTPTPPLVASCTCPSGSVCPDGIYSHCPSGVSPAPTPQPTPQPTPVPSPTATPIVTLNLYPTPTPAIQTTGPTATTVHYTYSPELQKQMLDWCNANPVDCQKSDLISVSPEVAALIMLPALGPDSACFGLTGSQQIQDCLQGHINKQLAIGATAVTAGTFGPIFLSNGIEGVAVHATNLLSSLPAWAQTGLTAGGLTSIAVTCQSKGYSSSDCAAALTSLQVSQLAEQAAFRGVQNLETASAPPGAGTVTRIYGIPRGQGQAPPSWDLYPWQQTTIQRTLQGDINGAWQCVGGACQQAGYSSMYQPVVTYRGNEVDALIVPQNRTILLAQTANGVTLNPNTLLPDYAHDVGHAWDYQAFLGITQAQTEARQYYFLSQFYQALGDSRNATWAYNMAARFATGFYPP